MITVRVARVEPRPGRVPSGGMRVSSFLVVLAEETGGRALPVWLLLPDGGSLWRLAGGPADAAGMTGIPEEAAVRLLRAVGATVAGVDVDVSGTGGDELDPEAAQARIELAHGAQSYHVTARLGYCLALAAAADAPIRVADTLMDRLGRPTGDGDLVQAFLPPVAARPVSFRHGRRWRFEPRNLAFAAGLDRWDLDGSFLRSGESHQQDYSASAQDGVAALRSAVPEPAGSAGLEQTIFADDYRGRTVRFGGDVRAEDAAGHAGLFLRTGAEGSVRTGDDYSRDDGAGQSAVIAGSATWSHCEVIMRVPGDADVIRFGVYLTGPGQIDLRDAAISVLSD
jgi:hypothetical protein